MNAYRISVLLIVAATGMGLFHIGTDRAIAQQSRAGLSKCYDSFSDCVDRARDEYQGQVCNYERCLCTCVAEGKLGPEHVCGDYCKPLLPAKSPGPGAIPYNPAARDKCNNEFAGCSRKAADEYQRKTCEFEKCVCTCMADGGIKHVSICQEYCKQLRPGK
ncbi:MAG: hypothetical protein WAW37_09345 [Syntrophobacteraceae bacterium]